MNARRSKEHHYIPKIIQKAFRSNNDGAAKIWHSKKGRNDSFKPPSEKLTEKAFVRTNYYTVLGADDELSDVVERKFYGEIDGYWGRVLPELFEIFGTGRTPQFEGAAKDSLFEVIHHMMKRTPEFVPEHDDLAVGTEIIKGAIERCGNTAKHADEKARLLVDLKDTAHVRSVGRDVRVRAVARESPLTMEKFSEFSVRWAVSETKHSFILSSRAVYRIGNGGSNGLNSPHSEMWFPLSPKIVLVLVRDPKNVIPRRVVETPERIREINEFAVRTSFEVASHSKHLLESLLGQKAVSYKPN